MGHQRIVLPVVRPRRSAKIALREGEEAVLSRHGLALRLPVAEIGHRPVHKDDGRAGALVNVGQLHAVHLEVTRRRRVIGSRRPGETTTEHHDGKPDGAEPVHNRLLQQAATMVMGGFILKDASIIAQRSLPEGRNFDLVARTAHLTKTADLGALIRPPWLQQPPVSEKNGRILLAGSVLKVEMVMFIPPVQRHSG
jgi:hypothetical protein